MPGATPSLLQHVEGRRLKHARLDAHRLARKLWIGAYPSAEARGVVALRTDGFTMLVACALEHQPSTREWPGIQLVKAPLDDSRENNVRPMHDHEWDVAAKAAWRAAAHHKAGGRVLFTCHMGLNRSGLVAAITLHLLAPKEPIDRVIATVKGRRPEALFNPQFVAALHERLP